MHLTNAMMTLPRKSGEKVWNVFYKKNDASNCSGMQQLIVTLFVIKNFYIFKYSSFDMLFRVPRGVYW